MTIPKFKRTTAMWEPYSDDYPPQPVQIDRCVNPENDVWRIYLYDGEGLTVDGCDLTPHPEAPATNEELVQHHFKWSRYGAMGQVFVMEAILKYASQVMLMSYDERAAMEKGLIHPDLWEACAKEALEFYGNRNQ